ncbi:phospholipase effector Tle1 domain-containing protein [Mesorhizobium sp. A556]
MEGLLQILLLNLQLAEYHSWQADPNDPDDSGANHLQQVWFVGNHSDVGGSYPENDSRLLIRR